MTSDLAVVKLSLKFSECIILDLKKLSKQTGFEVKYLCHDEIPVNYANDDIVMRSHLRLSASRSRNLLFQQVHSSRILFLDEDATLSAAAIQFLSDFLTMNERCHIIFSGKREIMNNKKFKMNDWNFYRVNRFYCEWNTVYDKTLIKNDRLFPGIGVGSRHEFWSGEGICSLLNIKPNAIIYLRQECVFHPPLNEKKDVNTARKYIKGYGFSMSYIFLRGKMLLKIITLIRFMCSLMRDVFFPKLISPSVEFSNLYIYGWYSFIWKLQGFYGQKK